MQASEIRVLLTLVVACYSTDAADAVTYTAKLLHPIGKYNKSVARGVSGETQIGNGYLAAIDHAVMWHGSAESFISLHPSGFQNTHGYAVSGNKQVGHGFGPITGNRSHALMWKGTAESYVDLHPPGYIASFAAGIHDSFQIGSAVRPGSLAFENAMLWNSTAESAVNLHPSGFRSSRATAVYADSQVGYGYIIGVGTHALKWTGTPESVVELHPRTYRDSFATGVWEDTQVGYGYDKSATLRALMWKGSAASLIDLHPPGFNETEANAVFGNTQVGRGKGSATNLVFHALLWRGSATSSVDLHPLLAGLPVPKEQIEVSEAFGIDAHGNIVGVARNRNQGRYQGYAILWTPVPEPTSSSILCCAIVGNLMLARYFRQKLRSA